MCSSSVVISRNPMHHMRALGGRRFCLTLGCGVVCTVLLWVGKLDPQTFRDIIIGTVAAYITGNTAQKFAPGVRVDDSLPPPPGA